MKCHCMSNSVYIECFKWNTANSLEKTDLKSCQVPCSKTVNIYDFFFSNSRERNLKKIIIFDVIDS